MLVVQVRNHLAEYRSMLACGTDHRLIEQALPFGRHVECRDALAADDSSAKSPSARLGPFEVGRTPDRLEGCAKRTRRRRNADAFRRAPERFEPLWVQHRSQTNGFAQPEWGDPI